MACTARKRWSSATRRYSIHGYEYAVGNRGLNHLCRRLPRTSVWTHPCPRPAGHRGQSHGGRSYLQSLDRRNRRKAARSSADCHGHCGSAQLVPKRICFVGVENQSVEEIGDFKEQIYEQINTLLLNSDTFDPISRRYVVAGLEQTRLRPDALFLPDNMQLFTATMAQQGQPFDYLLFAKLTSGTTEKNRDYQRDYLLTLELVDVQTGQFDKESAKIRKGYHVSRIGKLRNYNPFTRW